MQVYVSDMSDYYDYFYVFIFVILLINYFYGPECVNGFVQLILLKYLLYQNRKCDEQKNENILVLLGFALSFEKKER